MPLRYRCCKTPGKQAPYNPRAEDCWRLLARPLLVPCNGFPSRPHQRRACRGTMAIGACALAWRGGALAVRLPKPRQAAWAVLGCASCVSRAAPAIIKGTKAHLHAPAHSIGPTPGWGWGVCQVQHSTGMPPLPSGSRMHACPPSLVHHRGSSRPILQAPRVRRTDGSLFRHLAAPAMHSEQPECTQTL